MSTQQVEFRTSNDRYTQVIVHKYSNLDFVLITQTGKMGTLTLVNNVSNTVDCKQLLGWSNELSMVYGSQLMKITGYKKPIMMGLSLVECDENETKETLLKVRQVFMELNKTAD